LHAYDSTGQIDNLDHKIDAALYHLEYSLGASRIRHENADENSLKPIIRGETGIDFKNQQAEQPDLRQDKNGVWLHTWSISLSHSDDYAVAFVVAMGNEDI